MPNVIAETSSPHNHYRPDIDGLRCCAILPVVAYHAGIPGVTGGFVGVDIFFVISGFLITSLIRHQILTNRFTFTGFFARRARRLFPALFSMMAASSVLGWLLLMPGELEDFGESLATASAFSSNILFWSEAGYFDGPSDFKPLLHTWSLAVEEHFYLLFPLLLVVLRNLAFNRLILSICALTLGSLTLQLFFVDRSPDAAFFLSPNRFWELLIGSVTALALQHTDLALRIQPIRQPLAVVGITCLLCAIFGFDANTNFPGIAALLPCTGTALLIATGEHGGTALNRALAWRPMVAIGLISYSLYLWHWPVLVFLKHFTIDQPTAIETAMALVGSTLIAWLSWRFIERPFHTPPANRESVPSNYPQHRATLGEGKTLKVSAGVILLFIGLGLAVDQLEGVPGRLPDRVSYIASYSNDKPLERKQCTGKSAREVIEAGLCPIGNNKTSTSNENNDQQLPEFVVWGDSHAMVMIPTFEQVAQANQLVGLNATRNGCAPLLGAYRPEADPERECVAFNNAILETLESTPSVTNVVLIARWAIYVEGDRYKHESGKSLFLVDQESNQPSKLESVRVAQRALERTIAKLSDLGISVSIFAGVPEVGWNTPNVLAKSAWYGREVSIAPTRSEHQLRQRRSTEVLLNQTTNGVTVLLPETLLCQSTHCAIEDDGKPLYIDEDHLSSAGAQQLLPLVRKVVGHIGAKNTRARAIDSDG